MKKYFILEIITGIVLLGLLFAGILGFRAFRAPLAEPLNVALAPTSTGAPAATAAPAVNASSAKTCGLSGTMTVLMIGRDEHFWNPPYGADAIRMIKVDFSNKKVDVFAFQRDLKLDTPSLVKKYNVTNYQIGPAYVLVREKEGKETPGADKKATEAIAQVLYDNFSIVPDHYITLEESVLGDVVDKVGGIKVNVPEAITFENVAFTKGEQVFTGPSAMLYSRAVTTSPSEDEWNRFDRQALVFKALGEKLLDPANYTKLPDLYKDLNKSLVTDLSPEQITGLICMAKDIPMENVTMATIAKDQLNIMTDSSMFIKDMDAIREILWKIFPKK